MSITSTVKKYLKLLALLLLVNTVQAAVSFHAISTTYTVTGGSGDVTMTLPTVSNNDLVLFVVSNTFPTSGTGHPWTVPSGWTVAFDRAYDAIFYKIWHTGDSTTVISIPVGGGFESAGSVSYSGVDTTTPLDGNIANSWSTEIFQGGIATTNPEIILAPQVFPGWDNDMLIAAWFIQRVNGNTITPPGGFTTRIDQTSQGSPFKLSEKLLSAGGATGDQISTSTTGQSKVMGAQLLLKAASGGTAVARHVIPTIKGIFPSDDGTPGASTYNLLYPEDGDTVVVMPLSVALTSTNLAINNFTTAMNSNTVWAFYRKWHTGDATSEASTGDTWGRQGTYYYLISNWNYATTSISPGFDIGITSGTALSSTTVTTPTLTMKSADELILGGFFTVNFCNTTQLWTFPGNLQPVFGGANGCVGGAWQSNPTNPTGTYLGTLNTTEDLIGYTTAWGPVSTSQTKFKSTLF